MCLSQVNQVSAESVQTSNPQSTTLSEKDQALAAGYTEDQYNKIMQIPKFADENAIGSESGTLTSQQQAVLNEAYKYKGVPYKWGGNTPTEGFDCSGYVKWVYSLAVGIDLPRVTTAQESAPGTRKVSLNSLQAGDLLFWGAQGNSYHVAIYIGNGQYIHSPQPGESVKIGSRQYWEPNFAVRVLADNNGDQDRGPIPNNNGQKENEQYIHRLYNKNDGQHHYTSSTSEAIVLRNAGWNYEGVGWVAPKTVQATYRLYNPNNGIHHYTLSASERDGLVRNGWKSEGTSWYSGGTSPIYRAYNPNATGRQDSHVYTLNLGERDNLVKVGWLNEGIGWYGLRSAN